ncbi:hypothetical protein LJC07_04030, partial [Christensenellaceae bacterium OttesenSCG-928-L17]|nr:hypothetical protein [Christensenellaceae bacterium OttesenSCG-928-L17]
MEIWQWVVTAAGGISAIIGAATAIKRVFKPVLELSDRVKEVERHDADDMKRFTAINAEFERNRVADHAMYTAVLAMMDHMIEGNHTENLKTARKALNEHIIK